MCSKKNGVLVAIVIPTLNEEKHIEGVLEKLPKDSHFQIFVVDGGSNDNTVQLVENISAKRENVCLLENPKKIQAAALNLILKSKQKFEYIIRVDAHAIYPDDFVQQVLDALVKTGADSVVVPMKTVSSSPFQYGAALLFNSMLGNGGALHRAGGWSGYVDHGHHAGFTFESFKSLNGYDESFVVNEDAEYDYRLCGAGGKIWMESECEIGYVPRSDYKSLFRQYFKYGMYRYKNLSKHSAVPKFRQLLPVLAFLSVCLCTLSFVASSILSSAEFLVFSVPAFTYLLFMIVGVVFLCGWNKYALGVGVVSHMAFGCGFILGVFRRF